MSTPHNSAVKIKCARETYSADDTTRAWQLYHGGGLGRAVQRRDQVGVQLVLSHHQHHIDAQRLDRVQQQRESVTVDPASVVDYDPGRSSVFVSRQAVIDLPRHVAYQRLVQLDVVLGVGVPVKIYQRYGVLKSGLLEPIDSTVQVQRIR